MEWLNKKKKIVSIVAISVVSVIALSVIYLPDNSGQAMDFSKPSLSDLSPNKDQGTRRKIKIPDPSYKETADFQDFQAITQMYVHAMAPFKKETERWEKDLLSLRMQRERIELTKDAAEVAEYEAKLAGFKAKATALSSGAYKKSKANRVEEESDITNFEENARSTFDNVYNIRDLRVTFYVSKNKYAGSSATLSLGSEVFKSVKASQIIASQFLLKSFDDENYCVLINNLAIPESSDTKICRS